MSEWHKIVEIYKRAEKTVKIGIVGKYLGLHDSYKSIFEALVHGGIANGIKVQLEKIDSEALTEIDNHAELFKDVHGILIPGGFGERGLEGKILAAHYARINKLPCFGICLGLQVMVIEYARFILGLEKANSTEVSRDVEYPVISLLEEQIDIKAFGGTMRLGKSQTKLQRNSKIWHIYKNDIISERHRHRYEVSNMYRKSLADAGLIISGVTLDEALVEAIEWPDHPWGIGVQYHPEFKSRPVLPNPLFKSFIAAVLEYAKI